jgi:O-antigen/teichoic acid export membrane protein
MFGLIRSERLRKLIKNSGTLIMGYQFQAALLFFQSIVLAKTLGVSGYGKWAIVLAFCGLVLNFSTFRTGEVLGKYIVELRAKNDFFLFNEILKKSLLIDFLSRTASTVFIFILSFWVSKWFNGPEGAMVYLVYGISQFLRFINPTWFSLERDNSNYSMIAVIDFMGSVLRLVFILFFFFVLKRPDLISLALCFLFSGLVLFFIKCLRVKKLILNYDQITIGKILKSKSRNSLGQSVLIKEYWSFLKTTYFSTIFSSLIKKIDIFLVGFFFSSESVGLVRLAKNLTNIIQGIASNISKPIYQDFNELLANEKLNKILGFLKKNLAKYLVIIFVGLLISSLFIETFILIVYGAEYLEASDFFRLYLIQIFFLLGFFWLNPFVLSLKGWAFKLKALIVTFVFIITGSHFFVAWFEVWGCLILPLIGRIGMIAASLMYVHVTGRKRLRE